MPGYDRDADRFAELDTQVLGISVDSIFSHLAWQKYEAGNLHFPLCSDFFPHGEVALKYGVLRDGPPVPGMNDRAIFIVDKRGKIAFSRVYHLGELPENAPLLDVLRRIEGK